MLLRFGCHREVLPSSPLDVLHERVGAVEVRESESLMCQVVFRGVSVVMLRARAQRGRSR